MLVTLVFLFSASAALADQDGKGQNGQNQNGQNDDDHRYHTSANEMTLLGVAAASVLGAGTYLVRRAKSRPRA